MQPVRIATRWASSVGPENAWPEYPRPQMVRPKWQNLNGLWEYSITPKGSAAPSEYSGYILVPYPVESALSGVKKPLRPDQWLWYRRTLRIAPEQVGQRMLLHFGAVDSEATVYVNGREVGTHVGGYQSFTFEVTDVLKPGENELSVRVFDPTEQGPNPFGKQHVNAEWMYYTASSGIWQTVWMEQVPAIYIESLRMTPDVDRAELSLSIKLNGEPKDYVLEAIARSDQKVVARSTRPAESAQTSLRIDRPRLWSPDDPYLYDLEIHVMKDGRVVDSVTSYFGMRKIELRQDAAGRARIHLNNNYTFNLATVDQGFWPEGLYTAPTDAALKFDVQAIKALGFNTVRKHIKVEPQRWYYHCDKLGLLVWQDMPSANNDSVEGRAQFERESAANLARLHNHPSITMWVLFNEGWGAYDQERLAKWMKQADPSRIVNGHSGPYDQIEDSQLRRRSDPAFLLGPLGVRASRTHLQEIQYRTPASWMAGDAADMHFYPGPRMFPAQPRVASVTGEFGSFGAYIEGHVWDELGQLGRGVGGSELTAQQFLAAYRTASEQLGELEKQGLSGSAYFQIFDVESEQQGFITYDRQIAKVPITEIESVNSKIVPRAKNYAAAIEGFSVETDDGRSAAQRYESRLQEFKSGRRDLPFLRDLALAALRQADREAAEQATSEFLSRVPQPYTAETWRSIAGMTQHSAGRAFKLFRTRAAEVNSLLGEQAAEKKILEIITRELVAPYFQDRQRAKSWTDFERAVVDVHGPLGREAVLGARMMDGFVKEDWVDFGNCYARYFETALSRSPYSLHSLSYRVLQHVTDPRVIEVAVRVMKWQISANREAPVFGQYDPVELDTYARLLFKSGRRAEALQWQQRAVTLSDGRDQEIVQNYARMKSQSSRWTMN